MPRDVASHLISLRPARFGGAKLENFAVDDGWLGLVSVLCARIQSHVTVIGMQPVITEIRPKLGGLRITIDGGDAYVDGLVMLAAAFSRVTCEDCGAPAEVIPGPGTRTLCTVHAEGRPRLTRIRPLEASGPVLDLRKPRDVPPFVLPPVAAPGWQHLARVLEAVIDNEIRYRQLPPVAVTDIRTDNPAIDGQGGDGAHGRARAFFDLFLAYVARIDRESGRPLEVAA